MAPQLFTPVVVNGKTFCWPQYWDLRDTWERTERILLQKDYLSVRLRSLSHLSPSFPVQVTREARLFCGFGNGEFPGKYIWIYCQTWHFSLGCSEASLPSWLGSVLRKSCMPCYIGPWLRTCLKRWECGAFVGQLLDNRGEPLQVESVELVWVSLWWNCAQCVCLCICLCWWAPILGILFLISQKFSLKQWQYLCFKDV